MLEQSGGFPGKGISLSQGHYHRTTQTQKDIHASSGIQTHESRVSEEEDILCLRPLGHCNRSPISDYTILLPTKNKICCNLNATRLTNGALERNYFVSRGSNIFYNIERATRTERLP
jgi:hypothetical protein